MFEELVLLVFNCLRMDCPVLSGNMQQHIDIETIGNRYTKIVVSGPSYDQKTFRKTGQIVLTNEYDYAIAVNSMGAFGKHNKSEKWVNRSLLRTCQVVAGGYGAKVIDRLDRR